MRYGLNSPTQVQFGYDIVSMQQTIRGFLSPSIPNMDNSVL